MYDAFKGRVRAAVGGHQLIHILLCLQLSLFILTMFILHFGCDREVPEYKAVPDDYLYLGELQSDSYYQKKIPDRDYKLMTNLSQPMRSVEEISDLAMITAANALTLNFLDYYKQLDVIKSRFTAHGWKSFGKSLVSSGFIDAVLKKKLSVSVVVIGTPVLLNRGKLDGSYAWKFQMPLLVTYESSSDKKTQNQIVTIVFKRVPLVGKGAEVGIAVDSFVTSV